MSDQLAGQRISSPWFEGDQVVTQGFMPGAGAYEPEHTGVDVGLPVGTSLFAGVAGTIRDLVDMGGFGTYQVLTPDDHPEERIVLGHESAQLVPGGHVSQGQLVAYSGSSGNSTGPHLHFEDDLNGVPVDPIARLTAAVPAPGAGGGGVPDALLSGLESAFPPAWLLLHKDEVAKLPKQTADALGQSLGLASIGSAIAGLPAGIGHGLADAAGAGAHNFEVFAQKQVVALVVAIVVLLVLFG